MPLVFGKAEFQSFLLPPHSFNLSSRLHPRPLPLASVLQQSEHLKSSLLCQLFIFGLSLLGDILKVSLLQRRGVGGVTEAEMVTLAPQSGNKKPRAEVGLVQEGTLLPRK